jgi:hypothetical protein
MELTKYTVFATLTKEYEVEVEASDPAAAIEKLDDWIADDFEPFEVNGEWKLEAR